MSICLWLHRTHFFPQQIIREAMVTSDLHNEHIARAYGYFSEESTMENIGVSLVLPLQIDGCVETYLSKHRPVSELVKSKIVRASMLVTHCNLTITQLRDVANALKYCASGFLLHYNC